MQLGLEVTPFNSCDAVLPACGIWKCGIMPLPPSSSPQELLSCVLLWDVWTRGTLRTSHKSDSSAAGVFPEVFFLKARQCSSLWFIPDWEGDAVVQEGCTSLGWAATCPFHLQSASIRAGRVLASIKRGAGAPSCFSYLQYNLSRDLIHHHIHALF